jgi:hypothetical protein
MFSTSFKRPLATLAIVGGLLIAAAPASAKTESPKDQLSGVHAVQAVSDGTSNTVLFAEATARAPLAYTLENCMISG